MNYQQLSIEFRPMSRASDPGTSADACKRVDVATQNARILQALDDYQDGLTTKELANVLNIARESLSPRMAPLVRSGVVVIDGKRDGSQVYKRGAV
jgi:hypothetical protein